MREKVLRVAVVKAFAGMLKAAKEAAYSELLEAAAQEGSRRFVAMLPSGTTVADVTIAVPKRAAVVYDPDAFMAYIAEVAPEHIVPEVTVLVPQTTPAHVNPECVEAMLPFLVEGYDGAYDPTSGELVPGVKFTARAPYPSVKFIKGGEALLLEAIKADPRMMLSE